MERSTTCLAGKKATHHATTAFLISLLTLALQSAWAQQNTVTVQDSNSYGTKLSAGENSSATKTTTPLVEMPLSVSVITRQQMNDQNTPSLNETLRYPPAVAVEQWGGVTAFDQFTLRRGKLQLAAQNLLNLKVVAGCYSTVPGCFWARLARSLPNLAGTFDFLTG